jgi:UDP:flavonoid glycosyltransferase YjiC (YdhE family)
MSHYLFVTFFAGGNVPPQLGLAQRLVERGHRVTVLADDCLAPEAEQTGARFVGYQHAKNRPTKALEHYPISDWELSPLAGFRQMVEQVVCGEPLEIAHDVMDLHAADPIDALACCGMILGPILGAEKIGVPSLVLMSNLDLRPVPGRPPNGPGLGPMRGPLGWLRDRVFDGVARRIFAAGRPKMQAARRELGLPRVDHPLDEYSRAHCVLLLTSRAFDFQHEPLPRTVYCGPVLDDPAWIDDSQAPDLPVGDEPLVLATLGSTFQDQKQVYQRVVEGLGRIEARSIVTLGEIFEPGELEPRDHVTVVRAAAHGPILARASAALIHCGHGSVIKALAAGVPLVCMPLGRDQHDNAARVAWHGAGVVLKPEASAEVIAGALSKVLATPSMREAARDMAREIRAEIDRDLAIEELEAAAGRGRIGFGQVTAETTGTLEPSATPGS